MKKYILRRNFTTIHKQEDQMIRGKIAFKTAEDSWLNTHNPVIVLVSVHSNFHEGINGDFKMNALVSTIKGHVNGKVTILFSDRAHFRTASLDFNNNLDKAFDHCLSSAQSLIHRYSPYFEGCNVSFWHSYISHDEGFLEALESVNDLYQKDPYFRNKVNQDVEDSYTDKYNKQYLDKLLYIGHGVEDLLEQCASLLILSKKGYRYQFYPGKPNGSVEYACKELIPEEKRIAWINVFLSIENKSKFIE